MQQLIHSEDRLWLIHLNRLLHLGTSIGLEFPTLAAQCPADQGCDANDPSTPIGAPTLPTSSRGCVDARSSVRLRLAQRKTKRSWEYRNLSL